MALPLPPGLTPPEIAFLCEMELVTVIPRQRMDPLQLLSAGRSTPLPLYLALLLHRQRRANILPPPWLGLTSLEQILQQEIEDPEGFAPPPPWPTSASASTSAHGRAGGPAVKSPPFLPTSTVAQGREAHLPYHWLELSELLLAACPESFGEGAAVNAVRGLLRDIREVRQSKLRAGMKGLEGGGVVSLRGVGAMEIGLERGFVAGVIGGLRLVGSSREAARRDREGEDGDAGGLGDGDEDEDEMDL